MEIKISKRNIETIISQKELNAYRVVVGILSSDEGAPAKVGASKLAGFKGIYQKKGTARRTKRGKSRITIGQQAHFLAARYGWAEKPADNPNNKDVQAVADRLIDILAGVSNASQRYLNACRALIRNPILRREYPKNKPSTVKRKGFNHPLIDTSNFFKTIKARFLNGK